MSKSHYFLFILTLCCGLAEANPCSEPKSTSRPSDSSGNKEEKVANGIAGTGKQVAQTPTQAPTQLANGIAGTGRQVAEGVTVLFGVITGFASICVNGVEIHFDDTTPISLNGVEAKPDQLAVGQVVAVLANGQGSEVDAQKISVLPAVQGPITRIDHANLQVMGQPIKIDAHTQFAAGFNAQSMQLGQVVSVHGLRTGDGTVVASYVAASQAAHTLFGTVSEVRGAMIAIDGVQIDTASLDRSYTIGTKLWVAGQWKNGVFNAERANDEASWPSKGIDYFVVQGYAHAQSGALLIDGAKVSLAGKDQQNLERVKRGEPVVVTGRVLNDGAWVVDRVETPQRVDKNANPSTLRKSDPKALPSTSSHRPIEAPPRPNPSDRVQRERIERGGGLRDRPRYDRPERGGRRG